MQDRTTIQLSNDLRKELRELAAKRDENYQELLKDMIEVFNELDKDKTIISLPKQLAEKVKEKIKDTDFSSVSEYTTFLLRLMLYEEAKVGESQQSSIKDGTKKENIDEKQIKQRLEKLGYI